MVLEVYVRDAPKGHELYRSNIEARRYACREYGDKCGQWMVGEALRENGHALLQGAGSAPNEWGESRKATLLRAELPVSDSR